MAVRAVKSQGSCISCLRLWSAWGGDRFYGRGQRYSMPSLISFVAAIAGALKLFGAF
jgi:hypothetical protein